MNLLFPSFHLDPYPVVTVSDGRMVINVPENQSPGYFVQRFMLTAYKKKPIDVKAKVQLQILSGKLNVLLGIVAKFRLF